MKQHVRGNSENIYLAPEPKCIQTQLVTSKPQGILKSPRENSRACIRSDVPSRRSNLATENRSHRSVPGEYLHTRSSAPATPAVAQQTVAQPPATHYAQKENIREKTQNTTESSEYQHRSLLIFVVVKLIYQLNVPSNETTYKIKYLINHDFFLFNKKQLLLIKTFCSFVHKEKNVK